MTLEYFPKDTVILSAGHRASEALYIVQKGGVKLALRTQVGKELILDMRSRRRDFRCALADEPRHHTSRRDCTGGHALLQHSGRRRSFSNRTPPRSGRLSLPHFRHALHGPQSQRTAGADQLDGQFGAAAVLALGL